MVAAISDLELAPDSKEVEEKACLSRLFDLMLYHTIRSSK